MVNLPTVVKDTKTHNLNLQSITQKTTTDGKDKEIEADELKLGFKHTFQFRSPLPKGASEVTMDTTLFIYSTEKGIVRFSDRPQGNIPGNALLSVCPLFISMSLLFRFSCHFHFIVTFHILVTFHTTVHVPRGV